MENKQHMECCNIVCDHCHERKCFADKAKQLSCDCRLVAGYTKDKVQK